MNQRAGTMKIDRTQKFQSSKRYDERMEEARETRAPGPGPDTPPEGIASGSSSGGMDRPGVGTVETAAGTQSPDVVRVLEDGTKVKVRIPRMRACNERNAKGKLCAGHLKRWYQLSAEARQVFGDSAEVYRCERCHTIYLPNPEESPRTRTLAW